MELHLTIIGIILILIAVIHFGFPKYFKWDQELISLSMINRQMMYVHSFFIAFTLLLMGILCLVAANELIETPLGKKICLGIGLFWTARLFVQFFGSSKKNWKGKRFETSMHILFSILWTYLSVVFLTIYIQ